MRERQCRRQLILNETGQTQPETMTYSLTGINLTLNGTDTYDFNADQVEEPATFETVLAKQ